MNSKPFVIPEDLLEQLYTLEDALIKCFGGYEEQDDGYLKVTCCGKIQYGSGVFGPDLGYCMKCGRKVVLALSPHVSPLLIGEHCTHIPNDELIEAMGNKCWMVVMPQEDECNSREVAENGS